MSSSISERPDILAAEKNCWRIERAGRAAPLVDGVVYFAALRSALLNAERRIIIVGWEIDGRIPLPRTNRQDHAPETLCDLIDFVAKRSPELDIHILLWDYTVLYAVDRQALPKLNLDWAMPKNVTLVLDNNVPVGGSHHEKIVCVDDKIAFVGGFDLAKGRLDSAKHAPGDPLRVDHQGNSYAPFHDVQLVVDCAAAMAVADHCRRRWTKATEESLATIETNSDPWPEGVEAVWRNIAVGVARTLPAFAGEPGAREILTLYADAIAAARSVIYLENQFLAAGPVAEALAHRLEEPKGPEIVIVTQWAASSWLEEQVMGVRRDQIMFRLQQSDRHDRLRILAPVVPGVKNEDYTLHAKIAVFDDRLVLIGSANLNNRSMGYDSECNLAVDCVGENDQVAARNFRNDLLAEHLGTDRDAVELALEQSRALIPAIEELMARHGRRLEKLPYPESAPEVNEAFAELGDPERPISANEWLSVAFAQPDGGRDRTPISRAAVWLAAAVVLTGLLAAWINWAF